MYSNDFEVEVNGKIYQCQRRIEGTKKLRQFITVIGVGRKEDSATYGEKDHPVGSMELAAKIIASEIILNE